MNSPWEHIIRFFLGMLAGILVYQLTLRSFLYYYKDLKMWSLGYGLRFFGCLLGMIAFAMFIEDSGVPWTFDWWKEVLFKGDWIFVLIASPILALGPWMLEKRQGTAKPKMDVSNEIKN